MRSLAKWTARWSAAAAAALVLAGCTTGGDSVSEPTNAVANMPWKVTLNHEAITMQTGSVLQLEATPLRLDGSVMTDAPAVTWTTSDTAIKVDATGKITASSAVPYGRVFATIQGVSGGIYWTVSDTAQVTISDTLYHFSAYKMWLDGPTTIPLNVWRNFDAVLLDGSGQPLLDEDGDPIWPNTSYSTDAPSDLYSLYTGGGQGHNLGTVKVKAQAYLFGTVYTDSVTLKLTWPDTVTLYISRVNYSATPSPSAMAQTDITIQTGGVVKFYNQNTTLPADIKFDDLGSVIGGDIPVVAGYPGSPVTFPTPGKYTWSSSLGFKGTITVVNP
jgi:hypothetical protein